MDRRTAYVDGVFNGIKTYKDSLSIKNILKRVLKELGYYEIVDNETVIYTLSIMYAKENDDSIEGLDHAIQPFIINIGGNEDKYLERTKKLEKYLYDKMTKFIANNFRYKIENNKIILEKTYVKYQGNYNLDYKMISDDYTFFIEHQIDNGISSSKINIDNIIIDLSNNQTTHTTLTVSTDINHIPQPYLSLFSTFELHEYDNECKMIRALSVDNSDKIQLESFKRGYEYQIKNYIVSERTYTNLTDIKAISNESSLYTVKERIKDKDYTYEEEMPNRYVRSIIDYYSGYQFRLDDEEIKLYNFYDEFIDNMDLDSYQLTCKPDYKSDYESLQNDITTIVTQYDIEKMIPDEIERKMWDIIKEQKSKVKK